MFVLRYDQVGCRFIQTLKYKNMKSSIKIDFTEVPGKGLQPVIAVIIETSDDPRDGLLRTFFQQLGHKSNWVRVVFDHHLVTDTNRGEIKSFVRMFPLTPDEFKSESDEMLLRISEEDRQNYSRLISPNTAPSK